MSRTWPRCDHNMLYTIRSCSTYTTTVICFSMPWTLIIAWWLSQIGVTSQGSMMPWHLHSKVYFGFGARKDNSLRGAKVDLSVTDLLRSVTDAGGTIMESWLLHPACTLPVLTACMWIVCHVLVPSCQSSHVAINVHCSFDQLDMNIMSLHSKTSRFRHVWPYVGPLGIHTKWCIAYVLQRIKQPRKQVDENSWLQSLLQLSGLCWEDSIIRPQASRQHNFFSLPLV